MAKFRTVGKVIESEAASYGVMFRIQCQDETQKVLPYACGFTRENETRMRFGMQRIAELVRDCGKEYVQDSEELHDIEFIVTHDGTPVKKLEPLRVMVPHFIHREKPSWFARLFRRGE